MTSEVASESFFHANIRSIAHPLDISVVIVNYRTKHCTRDAIASVLSEREVRNVIVVDNNSGDDSVGFLRGAISDARLIVIASDRNGGFGAGVNEGVKHCASPVLFILNSDAILSAGSLRILSKALLKEERVGVVAPAIFCDDGRTPQAGAYGVLPRRRNLWLPGRLARIPRSARETSSPQWVSGVAMLMRRVDFEDVGGFDERFNMYFEDIDFCRRLRDSGKSIKREPGASVRHKLGRSWKADADRVGRFHESKIMYYRILGATPIELGWVRFLGWLRVRAVGRRQPAPADSDSCSPEAHPSRVTPCD